MIEVERIRDALCQADPQHAEAYRQNSAAYLAKLRQLDADLMAVAAKAPKKVFITAHAAFGHLADDYGLRQLSVAGLSPEAEPTPGDMQCLIAIIQKEHVRYVFLKP